jgi:hypothetical protein
VQKINYPTFKQAKNQTANQKQRRPHKQTCGTSGQFTSRKEKTPTTTQATYFTDKEGGQVGRATKTFSS